jgi:hypothetical protein
MLVGTVQPTAQALESPVCHESVPSLWRRIRQHHAALKVNPQFHSRHLSFSQTCRKMFMEAPFETTEKEKRENNRGSEKECINK